MSRKPQNHGKQWTDREISQLKGEARRDIPTTEIAKKHKRTEASIRAKAQDENISLRRPN